MYFFRYALRVHGVRITARLQDTLYGQEVISMRIERINENQIRCTLSNFDLSVRNLNLSELAYGSEKARGLFREMIQRASSEVGFDAEDIPLMVEAIPMANESVVLIITKIEDPEELDTRFSKFSPADDDEDNIWNTLANELLEGAEGVLNLPGVSAPSIRDKADAAGRDESRYMRIFTFPSLDLVCEAARETGSGFEGVSVLYKNPSNKHYYLVLKKEDSDELAFSRTCNILAEYGSRLKSSPAAEAYYTEHYEVIIKKEALNALSKL